MEKYEKDIKQLLHRAGAKLLRRKRHQIYRLQSGENFVQACTPSDWRRSRNALGVLKRILKPHPDGDGNHAMVPAQPDPEPQKLRRRLPDWEPRAKGEVRIPSLGGNRRAQREKKSKFIPLSEMFTTWLTPLSFPLLWWSLDVCGPNSRAS